MVQIPTDHDEMEVCDWTLAVPWSFSPMKSRQRYWDAVFLDSDVGVIRRHAAPSHHA